MPEDNSPDVAQTDEYLIASTMRHWYEDARDRGHKEYIREARENERYYTPGKQWTDEEKDYIENVAKRVAIEVNEIFPAINTAMGEQIFTRVDVTCRAKKSPASQQTALILSKLLKHIQTETRYQNVETQVCKDGYIRKRGYFDIRMVFDENLKGEISIEDVDPLDILPDPDAQSYDPSKWRRVTRTRWLSLDEIEQLYGIEVRRKAEEKCRKETSSWAAEGVSQNDQEGRNAFGSQSKGIYADWYADIAGQKSVRVIETQHIKFNLRWFFVTQEGDLREVPDNMDMAKAKEFVLQNGYILTKQNRKRVRWTVSTYDVVLMDEWSPYDDFTITPYFPFFERGKTIGLVDNAISPQKLLNGAITSYLHIVKSTANSGWLTEEDSLTTHTVEDLEDVGNKTGLVIEYKKGSNPPTKIQPNQIPTGTDRLITMGDSFIQKTIGVSDAEQGLNSPEVSGVAIQTKVFQGKLQRALPLDNLAFTRLLVFSKVIKLVQKYFTEERIIKIIGKDSYGNLTEEEVVVNQATPEGAILNDITLGEYEIVLDVVPTAAAFEAQEFQQLLKMREIGITSIPDEQYILKSNITDKQEVIKAIAERSQDPLMELKVRQLEEQIKAIQASTRKTDAEATVKAIEGQFSAVQTAQTLVTVPVTAKIADELLQSAGYVDHNAPPIIPQDGGASISAVPEVRKNTSPMFPPRPVEPDEGMMKGIEGGQQNLS